MYVLGTAGHVDHGKSTLVKALTGIDPDRWEEEQRREMTIDLGFAWLTLPSGRSVSIVDVPGHERFIKNMLAGVGGYDAALLVVAADEAVMPQTAEHLAILDLLGLSRGLVVLSKADTVDAEWLALVAEEVRERLQGTTLADAPLVAVSARTGQGLDALRGAIDALLDTTPSRTVERDFPRLSIDRAFTIGGFGAVVTGTLAGGPLHVGDELEVLPQGSPARVRGLQTHQRKVEQALPGTRVAVNLAGISHNAITRGDLLAPPGRVRPTDVLDARLRLAAGAPVMRQNDRLELFVGAAEASCRVTLLDREELGPGEEGWVQIRLAKPLAAVRGDRYILRLPSPSTTVGGGRVIEPHPARHRRFRAEVLAGLEALARGTPEDLLLRVLADGKIHPLPAAIRASGMPAETAHAAIATLVRDGRVVRSLDHLAATSAWQASVEALHTVLAGYHRRFPLRSWMPREELRSRLKLSGPALDALLAGVTEVAEAGENGARLVGHRPRPSTEQERQLRRFLAELAAAPYSPPAPDLDGELLGMLVEQGDLTRIAPDLLFLSDAYRQMVAWVQEQVRNDGSLTLAQFRDRFGSSRKYAQAVLEHLDERKITRRVGDARIRY
jgi:selenocysteine-specific elongation factor